MYGSECMLKMSLRGLLQPLILDRASEEGRLHLEEVLSMGELACHLLPKLPGAAWLHSGTEQSWGKEMQLDHRGQVPYYTNLKWQTIFCCWRSSNLSFHRISLVINFSKATEEYFQIWKTPFTAEWLWEEKRVSAMDQNHKIGKQVCMQSTVHLAVSLSQGWRALTFCARIGPTNRATWDLHDEPPLSS